MKLPVPVIVVGNITVGGTGKTPVVIWLVEALKRNGLQPAVVSRGYGSSAGSQARKVSVDDRAEEVGDEPLLISSRTSAPVYVHTDRVLAAQRAIAEGADVLVADDGLQHYRLARDVEIAIVDARRGFGNEHLLPRGPLREPITRLDKVDITFWHCPSLELDSGSPDRDRFTLAGGQIRALNGQGSMSLDEAKKHGWVAMAAIGHPERFFSMLNDLGVRCDAVALPDHAEAAAYPLLEYAGRKILVTEKDAVKLRGSEADIWLLPVDVVMPEGKASAAVEKILNLCQLNPEQAPSN